MLSFYVYFKEAVVIPTSYAGDERATASLIFSSSFFLNELRDIGVLVEQELSKAFGIVLRYGINNGYEVDSYENEIGFGCFTYWR